MELYTLHLHQTLVYERVATPGVEALLGMADAMADGDEGLALWEVATLALEGEDGPRLRKPLAAPLWMGNAAHAGALGGKAGLWPDAAAFALERGRYLFCQARAADIAELYDVLEGFLRESWWRGKSIRDRLYLRLVREDGKTAIQALARDDEL